MKIPFHRISMAGGEADRIAAVLESGWLTSGPQVDQFESAFAACVGAKHAVAVNSCTAALHLALEAVGVGKGDGVIVPTVTFTATAEVVYHLGAEVVLVDVDPLTGLLTPGIVKECLNRVEGVVACVPVHIGGNAVDMEGKGGVLDLCQERNISVIEDAAHAFPASTGIRMIGCCGDATCFSFYANKTLTTGEGGMLTTDDDAIADRARLMRLHGIDRSVWERVGDGMSRGQYDVLAAGFKYNMTDIAASMGIAQLAMVDQWLLEREAIADRYDRSLAEISGLTVPKRPLDGHSAHHLYAVQIDSNAKRSRDEVAATLLERGVETSIHYRPLHRMSAWGSEFPSEPLAFPGAEHIWASTLSLPMYPSLSEEEQSYIVAAMADILG
jgi:dTDP-4-amino-4,6-dideoxygalactose transaminase